MNSETVNLTTPPQTASSPPRAARPVALDAVVARVRRRWRARLLLTGLFWILAVGGVSFVGAVWLLDQWHFAPGAIVACRIFLIAALVALLYGGCLRPLRRRADDARVALYLEEHEPRLRMLLSSAIDARAASRRDTSAQLVRDLEQRALAACAELERGDGVERPALRRAGARLALIAGALLALGLWPPEFLRLGAPALLMPWTSAADYSPYRLELSPGDIEIARGGDQLISLRIPGYDGGDVWLYTSPDGGVSWSQSTMAAGDAAGLYETFLFDIARDVDYFVRAAGQQTATFRISVTDIPVIETLRLRYHYPAYTRLEAEVFEGSGDISALVGTRVEVLVTPTGPIPGGALILDDGSRIALTAGADGEWTGSIGIERDGAYRIRFARAGGAAVDASPEYRITALDDRRPGVAILSPGRDVKVSMVEEPVMRVRADDDQGVARLDLVLSVNGEPEQRIPLLRDADGESARVVSADHVLFLENLDLAPGDLISYYVQAEDRGPDGAARVATSDIFFYQVRPFSLNYRSAQQQGGGGGGQGGQQQQGFLSEQQKQFVVATFKMIRDRDQYDDNGYRDNLELLAKAQARIRDRVEAIVRRISRRPMNQLDEHYKVITAELPRAAAAMREVERQLKASDIEPALTDAQIALKHLQRADAAFRDINVALSNQNGGGAGGSNLEDLANLFQLEMDKLRNQYDSVQHARQQSPEQLIDETLKRLQELARRQQRELERSLRRLGGNPEAGNGERQRALAEELEEMARRLERLTRDQPNAQMQQSIRQMREAAEAMRRAAENANGGGGGGTQQAREAAERLREAQRLLDESRVAQFGDEVERTLRRAELAEKRQQAIRRQVEELERPWGDTKKAQLRQIDERKQALNEELASLEGELNELTRAARSEQPEAGESLKQAIRAAREARLADRIGRTREMILLNQQQAAEDNERAIEQGIGRMRERIADALERVDEPGRRGLERSLEAMRDLARELRTLREQAAEQGSDGDGRGAREPQRADAGREGEGRGQQQSGQAGNATAGNAGDRQSRGQAGADAEGGGRGAFDGIVERAGEIGRSLRNHGVDAGDIDPVLAQIERLKRRDADLGEASDLALRALLELEFRLRRQLEPESDPDLLIADPRELPDEYRDEVADYYRELSRP